jgi:hypothetical protein
MERDTDMSLALDRYLTNGLFVGPPTQQEEAKLNIVVIFTSTAATAAALKKANVLADSLSARITLVVPQVVPYPLPLTSPPVLLDFQENRFRDIAAQSSVETRVQLYLCRDALEMLQKVLSPHSLVIMGRPKRWWPNWESRLARKLRRRHEVIFAGTE